MADFPESQLIWDIISAKNDIAKKATLIGANIESQERVIRQTQRLVKSLQNDQNMIHRKMSSLERRSKLLESSLVDLRTSDEYCIDLEAHYKYNIENMTYKIEMIKKENEEVLNMAKERHQRWIDMYESQELAKKRAKAKSDLKLQNIHLALKQRERDDLKISVRLYKTIRKTRFQHSIVQFAKYVLDSRKKEKIILELQNQISTETAELNKLQKEKIRITEMQEKMRAEESDRSDRFYDMPLFNKKPSNTNSIMFKYLDFDEAEAPQSSDSSPEEQTFNTNYPSGIEVIEDKQLSTDEVIEILKNVNKPEKFTVCEMIAPRDKPIHPAKPDDNNSKKVDFDDNLIIIGKELSPTPSVVDEVDEIDVVNVVDEDDVPMKSKYFEEPQVDASVMIVDETPSVAENPSVLQQDASPSPYWNHQWNEDQTASDVKSDDVLYREINPTDDALSDITVGSVPDYNNFLENMFGSTRWTAGKNNQAENDIDTFRFMGASNKPDNSDRTGAPMFSFSARNQDDQVKGDKFFKF